MSTAERTRALFMRHRRSVKNRQQSLLNRTAAEIGVEIDADYWSTIQGKPRSSFTSTYDRSHVALS